MAYWLVRIAYAIAIPATLFPCDPPGERIEWTAQQRQGARELALEHAKARGAKRPFVEFLRVAADREASGAPSRRHDHGAGLGLHGANIRYHGAGRNLCDPRQSVEAIQGLARDCFARHDVTTLRELQHCYGGRFECIGDGHHARVCTGEQQDRNWRAICKPLGRRGISCDTPIRLGDVGR